MALAHPANNRMLATADAMKCPGVGNLLRRFKRVTEIMFPFPIHWFATVGANGASVASRMTGISVRIGIPVAITPEINEATVQREN